MKAITRILAATVLTVVTAIPAGARIVSAGPVAGVTVDKFSLSTDMFSSDNRAGFTGGLMVEFNVPIIGVSFDVSTMYVHRSAAIVNGTGAQSDWSRNYIDIPLNFKYKIGLPGISHIFTPMVYTGPSFAFLVGDKVKDVYENRSFDFSWNFGFGVQLLDHIQLRASYGLGLTKAAKAVGALPNGSSIDGKNRYWTVTAAYLF